MSLRPSAIPPVPEETARVAQLAFPKGNRYLTLRAQERTDSTHVLAATRTLNRLESVGETLRAALNSIATVAPEWLQAWVPVEWFDRYRRAIEEYHLPKGVAARPKIVVNVPSGHFARDAKVLLVI